jgi:hypothetical protein
VTVRKGASELLRELRANHSTWNIACSYGCHEWVKGASLRDAYLKGCRNCDASYFCTLSE